jgi:hypothetical protein
MPVEILGWPINIFLATRTESFTAFNPKSMNSPDECHRSFVGAVYDSAVYAILKNSNRIF